MVVFELRRGAYFFDKVKFREEFANKYIGYQVSKQVSTYIGYRARAHASANRARAAPPPLRRACVARTRDAARRPLCARCEPRAWRANGCRCYLT